MSSHQSLKSEKSVRLILIYVVKCSFFMQFFWTSKFKGSPFLCQLRQEKVIYLKKEPYYPLFERNFETGQIFAKKGSRWVLAEGVLFHLRGCGHAKGYATPNVILDSKSSIFGLSNEVSFASKCFWKKVENWEKEKSIIWPNVSNCRWLYLEVKGKKSA